jgi:circadian clock protein KaiB
MKPLPKSAKAKKVSRPAKTHDKATPKHKYILKLYVAGASVRSRQAILRAREFCESELNGDYELEVIDIYQQPILARNGQILATPTLVKELPLPVRRLIGNLSNTSGMLLGLDLDTKRYIEL